MTGYEAFALFNSLKLHFTQDSYDYFKYNGKSNVSVDAFENRKDKYHFYKLSRLYPNKEECALFIISNLLDKDNLWVGELLEPDAEVKFLARQKVIQSLSYTFENEVNKIFDECKNPNDLLRTNGEYPKLLSMALFKEIQIETLCVLNSILNFVPMWTNKIDDTIRWPMYRKKILKYSPFINYDQTKFKSILKKALK